MLFRATPVSVEVNKQLGDRAIQLDLKFLVSEMDLIAGSQDLDFRSLPTGERCYVYIAPTEKAEEIEEFRAIVRIAGIKGHIRAIEQACTGMPELKEHFDAIYGDFNI